MPAILVGASWERCLEKTDGAVISGPTAGIDTSCAGNSAIPCRGFLRRRQGVWAGEPRGAIRSLWVSQSPPGKIGQLAKFAAGENYSGEYYTCTLRREFLQSNTLLHVLSCFRPSRVRSQSAEILWGGRLWPRVWPRMPRMLARAAATVTALKVS